jgi:hypothetical protein
VHVVQGGAALRVLERPDDDLSGGDEEEEKGVREEREQAEPGKREAPPAGPGVRPERASSFRLCRQRGTIVGRLEPEINADEEPGV